MGSFFLREPKRTALLLAGGTGLAPLLSILEKLSGMANPHPVHLIYGVNTDTDLVELDVLEDYKSRIDGFTFDSVVGDPASAAEKKGYVTNHFEPHHLADGDVDIYLCGPPPMVEGVRRHLEGRRHQAAELLLREVRPGCCPRRGTRSAGTGRSGRSSFRRGSRGGPGSPARLRNRRRARNLSSAIRRAHGPGTGHR